MPNAPAPFIDFHAHILDEQVLAASAGKTVTSGFGAKPVPPLQRSSSPLTRKMLEPALQIEDMDRRGIDISVISSASVIEGTSWADPKTEADLVKRINDTAADWCARYPTRFAGTFVLPLQDIDLSMAEMERAVGQLGLKAGNFSSNYKGAYLGHARYAPVWQFAEARKVPIFIHPEGATDPWFQDFGLWNSLGQSIEETKVMASIIYEGVFDKYPGITIIMAHGGGYFPHYCGRVDRNVTNMPHTMANISRKPSEYLRSFYYDSCTYDADVLAALIAIVGADRIVLGSDYPIGDPDPVGSLNAVTSLSAQQRRQIAGDTARGILDL